MDSQVYLSRFLLFFPLAEVSGGVRENDIPSSYMARPRPSYCGSCGLWRGSAWFAYASGSSTIPRPNGIRVGKLQQIGSKLERACAISAPNATMYESNTR